MQKNIQIFDSTLRDGAQAQGISFSINDKLKIVSVLDNLGVAYIEAGNPGSNPKDLEFFESLKALRLKNAKITAFGSTRRKNAAAADDRNVVSLLDAGTDVICIFGKSWDFHVTEVLNATLDENLAMIHDTVRFFKDRGKEVIFDAEHFFDGYKRNPGYALKTLEAAASAGADNLTICETNGGAFPREVYDITHLVCESFSVPVGVHCHNDGGMAVANSIVAVEAGASAVQGVFIGFGERCGNANLSTIIPNLQLKLGLSCIPQEQMLNLTSAALTIAEISNVQMPDGAPYVGRYAFAHKGGMHIDAVSKAESSYEHVAPEAVGNERHILTSEVSGRSTILKKIQGFDPTITKDSDTAEQVLKTLKDLEHKGYQFEAAEASFELVIRKHLGLYKPSFKLINLKIIGEQPYVEGQSVSAMIKIIVDGRTEMTAAEGDGPVNALDKALRKALEVFYPQLASVHLTDYKVRVLDSKYATASVVRVLIESSDGKEAWGTIGVSPDIIEASWLALVDSIEYKLQKG